MTDAELELYHSVIKHDFGAFAAKFFPVVNPHEPYEHNWHIDALRAVADNLRTGKTRYQTVAMPARCLKSYCLSIALPAFLLGHNPSEQIVCISYSDQVIEEHSGFTRMIMEDPLYQKLFPDTVLIKTTLRELRTSMGGKRFCTTIGGAMTGLGGNFFIVDDPMNAINAFSEPTNKQVRDFFDKTLSTRPNNLSTARMLVVMQRLHEGDLIGHLQATGGWEELRLQARATEEMFIDIGCGQTHHVKPGDLLNPTRLSEGELARLQARLGTAAFEAQYQQNPMPATGNQIKKEWLHTYKAAPPRDEGITVQSWDTASKTAIENDYSACTTWLLIEGTAYLLHVWRGKLAFPDLKNKIAELYYQWSCSHLLIEDRDSGQSLIQDLKASSPFDVIPFRSSQGKAARLDQASGAIESGRVLFPEEAWWLPDFLRELLAFPNGSRDDQVDSMTQFVLWMNERVAGGTFQYWPPYDTSMSMESIAQDILSAPRFR